MGREGWGKWGGWGESPLMTFNNAPVRSSHSSEEISIHGKFKLYGIIFAVFLHCQQNEYCIVPIHETVQTNEKLTENFNFDSTAFVVSILTVTVLYTLGNCSVAFSIVKDNKIRNLIRHLFSLCWFHFDKREYHQHP